MPSTALQSEKRTERTSPALNIDLDAVIERIAAGEYQSHIAREFGIPPQRLHEHISKHPAYRVALAARNAGKLDDAQLSIETAADLARAREQFKAASWRAERECPDEWGAKQQITVNHGVTVNEALGDLAHSLLDKMRVIEHETVAIAQQIEPETELPTDSMHSQDDEAA